MSDGFPLPPGTPSGTPPTVPPRTPRDTAPGAPRGVPNNRLAPWLVPLAVLWIVLLARSYGGTGVVTLGLGVGILMSVARSRRLMQS